MIKKKKTQKVIVIKRFFKAVNEPTVPVCFSVSLTFSLLPQDQLSFCSVVQQTIALKLQALERWKHRLC